MRNGPGSAYDKWNISMIIFDTYYVYISIYIYYLDIYPFTTGETTTGVIVAACIIYKVIFANDT